MEKRYHITQDNVCQAIAIIQQDANVVSHDFVIKDAKTFEIFQANYENLLDSYKQFTQESSPTDNELEIYDALKAEDIKNIRSTIVKKVDDYSDELSKRNQFLRTLDDILEHADHSYGPFGKPNRKIFIKQEL